MRLGELELLLAAERARARALEDEIRGVLSRELEDERKRVRALEVELEELRRGATEEGETPTERALVRQAKGVRRLARLLRRGRV